MSGEKRKVGRPRKYATRSERQKAYHERKKQRLKELEKQIESLETHSALTFNLEGDLLTDVSQFPWKKITPSEIALMGTQELDSLVISFQEKVQDSFSFGDSLENVILGVIKKNYLENAEESYESKLLELEEETGKNIANIEECIQQQTLLYLMESELASRERLEGKKTKLDLFEAKIDELEKDVTEKKVKVKKMVQ